MSVLKGIISIVPDVIGLFKKPTPEKGKQIAKSGTALTTIGAGILGTSLAIDPATLDGINLIIVNITTLVGAVTSLLGTIAVIAGKSQVESEDNAGNNS